MSEYKKFDSQVQLTVFNARLAKDPRVVETAQGEIVSFSVVLTSRREKHVDVWYDVHPRKFDVGKCKYLKKGDTVSFVGFPCAREWEGNDGKKLAHEVTNAEVHVPPGLFAELKERGWIPGAAKDDKPAPTKAPTKAAPKAVTNKKIAIVDPDEEDL